MDHKLKLMVVDDSPLFRTWLIRSLSEDDRFQIVGYAVNALDAQEKIPLLQPDMLTLDIEMPGMSGIDFLKQLLPVHPIPVILVSSLNLRVFDALEAGAVDFVRKPDEANGLSKEIFLSMLRSKLMVAAASHVHLPSAPADPQAGGIRKVSSLPPARNTFLQKPKIPLGASPETRDRYRGIYRRYRSHSRGSKEFSCRYSRELLSPSICLRFYSYVCRALKQDLQNGSTGGEKRGPDPQRSHAFSSRRSADACGTSWKLLCSQCTGRRKGKRTQTFRGCAF